MKPGKIYLIPTIIADNTQQTVTTRQVLDILPDIGHFLAEDVRTARRYLSSLNIYNAIEPLQFEVLNKDTSPTEVKKLLAPIHTGFHIGILSEAGCPGIADPGALAVRFAHDNDIQVIPLVGPSSILLALMASGLNGQCFAFQGYLPVGAEASRRIKSFEQESGKKSQTQIFIETPYRSNALFQSLIGSLQQETLLCVAVDITGKSEYIKTHTVRKWKMIKKKLPKAPAVFLFLSV
ncbi:MAG: SAM-dependent methyltransferase [Cyclobacteriaceae bacterium]|nr:SAM-dependent methyltransferase [Cyclobacteriaceae bacterium]MDH4294943.1 SAM-dependent methyltransferase [Cyclobacteriaceae bacterium]MDH5251038.1 SAM-dependent methyltransferase [Cyclobacteriaceae bacterium]